MESKLSKSVFITGASSGIGQSTALLATKEGWRVGVGFHQNEAKAQSTVSQIKQQGGDALAIKVDMAHPQKIKQAFTQFLDHFGQLDALVNSAGIVAERTRITNIKTQRFDQLWQVNVRGVFLCCQKAVELMSKEFSGKGGAIVNVSSIAAQTGSPNEYIDYAMGKGAIDTLTVGLAHEQGKFGIRVNSVRAGFIDTPMQHKIGGYKRLESVKPFIPLNRWGEADEVAQSILWLLSDKASYVTGHWLDCAGGRR